MIRRKLDIFFIFFQVHYIK